MRISPETKTRHQPVVAPRPFATSSLPYPSTLVSYELSLDEIIGAGAISKVIEAGAIRFDLMAHSPEGSASDRPLFPLTRPLEGRTGTSQADSEAHEAIWALDAPFVRVLGLQPQSDSEPYVTGQQRKWLTTELRRAPLNKALVVVTPQALAGILAQAVNSSRRAPNLILCGQAGGFESLFLEFGAAKVPFVAAGQGAYLGWGEKAADPGVFSVEISDKRIRGGFFAAEPSSEGGSASASFLARSKAILLPEGEMVVVS